MALQSQRNFGALFNRSNFLSSEIPPVVFAATHYSRLRDVGINDKQLVSQAGQLLVLLAEKHLLQKHLLQKTLAPRQPRLALIRLNLTLLIN